MEIVIGRWMIQLKLVSVCMLPFQSSNRRVILTIVRVIGTIRLGLCVLWDEALLVCHMWVICVEGLEWMRVVLLLSCIDRMEWILWFCTGGVVVAVPFAGWIGRFKEILLGDDSFFIPQTFFTEHSIRIPKVKVIVHG